jgi:glycosyltransferase involved in cell wall biosynthesis
MSAPPLDRPVWVVIRSLERGGAERQAAVLAAGLARRGVAVRVLVFYGGGSLEADLAAGGVEVVDLGKHGRWDLVRFLARFVREVRAGRPGWLVPYMTAPDLLAALAGVVVPGTSVVWNVAGSQRDPRFVNRLERAAERLQAQATALADAVVVNSEAGRDHLLATGFPPSVTTTVPNGVDTAAFSPSSDAREAGRAVIGVDEGDLVFGVVGRLHPVKGHVWAIRALAAAASELPAALLVCIGRGAPEERAPLVAEAQRCGVADRVRWVDQQDDIVPVLNALDVLVSPSESEGLANVLLEAMACGVPAVVTDVGDSALAVGGHGIVVPPCDAEQLGAGMVRAAATAGDPVVRAAVRAAVVARFGEDVLVDRTIEVLAGAVRPAGRRRPRRR